MEISYKPILFNEGVRCEVLPCIFNRDIVLLLYCRHDCLHVFIHEIIYDKTNMFNGADCCLIGTTKMTLGNLLAVLTAPNMY